MHFPDFSLEKLDKKISQHVALLLNLGVLKNVCWLWGGGQVIPPASYGPEQRDQLWETLSNAYFCPVFAINVGVLE